MYYEKLSGDRLEEAREVIRVRVQATSDVQNKRFLKTSAEIICNPDMSVGEIRQF